MGLPGPLRAPLGLTDWNRASVLEDMLRRFSQPPFTNQLNHLKRLEATRQELQELRHQLTSERAAQARVIYEQALAENPRIFGCTKTSPNFWNP